MRKFALAEAPVAFPHQEPVSPRDARRRMTSLDLAWLLSASGFAVATCATPGPNNTMVAASGANWGFSASLPHMLGISLGFPVMLIAVALGVGDLFRVYPFLHEALKWVGAAYLIWLAVQIARADAGDPADAAAPRRGRPMSFLQAALFQWANPKAWIIAIGAILAYTRADGPPLIWQALVLALVFLLATLPSVAFWTLTGVGAARFLRTPRARRGFNVLMAALLVASLVPLAWE